MKSETTWGKSTVCCSRVSTKDCRKSWRDASIFPWQPTDLPSLQPQLAFSFWAQQARGSVQAPQLCVFPIQKTLTVPPSPVQMLLSTWKQSPKSLCWDIYVVAAAAHREGALRKTALCSCGSHRAVQTHMRIRAVAHALNTAFVYVSYLDLTEWEKKKDITQCYSTSYMNKQILLWLGVSNYKGHLGVDSFSSKVILFKV